MKYLFSFFLFASVLATPYVAFGQTCTEADKSNCTGEQICNIPEGATAGTCAEPSTDTPTATDTDTPAESSSLGFVPLTSIPGFADVTGAEGIAGFLNNLYRICIGIAAALAVLQITRAGILFMTNTGSYSHNEKAKTLIRYSLFGLLLTLSPAIVFGIIDPRILNISLNTGALQTGDLGPNGIPQSDDPDFVDDSCDFDFATFGPSDRYATYESMANDGEDTTGKECCRVYGGVAGSASAGEPPETQEVCDIATVGDRWTLFTRVTATIVLENSNGVLVEHDDYPLQIQSLGVTSSVTRDRDLVAAHGFRSEAACTAVKASIASLSAHVTSNPSIGRIKVFLLGPGTELETSAIRSIQEIDTANCDRLQYNTRD